MTMHMQRGSAQPTASSPSKWCMMRYTLPIALLLLSSLLPVASKANMRVVPLGEMPPIQLVNQTTINGSGYDLVTSIVPNRVGGYVIAGVSDSQELQAYNAPDFSSINSLWFTFVANLSSEGEILALAKYTGILATKLVIDDDGAIYVTGKTFVDSFGLNNTSVIGTPASWEDGDDGNVFLMKLDPDLYMRWGYVIGGREAYHELSTGDFAKSMELDREGNVILTGSTYSVDFPVLNASDAVLEYNADVFLMKFTSNGTLLWSTLFGGYFFETAYDIAVDADNNIYVAGFGQALTFPFKPPVKVEEPFESSFVTKFDPWGKVIWARFVDYNKTLVGRDGSLWINSEGKILFSTSRGFGSVEEFNEFSGVIYSSERIGYDDLEKGIGISMLAEMTPDGKQVRNVAYYGYGKVFGMIHLDKDGVGYLLGSNDPSLLLIDGQKVPIYRSPIESGLEATIDPQEFIVQEDRIVIVGQIEDKDGIVLIFENPRESLSQETSPIISESEVRQSGGYFVMLAMLPIIFGRKFRRDCK